MIHTNPQHPELIVAFRWRAVYKYYYFIIRGDDLEEMKSGLSSQKGITMLRILNDTTKKHRTKICLVLFGAPAGIRIPDTLIKRAHRAEHSDFRSFEFSLFLCKAS